MRVRSLGQLPRMRLIQLLCSLWLAALILSAGDSYAQPPRDALRMMLDGEWGLAGSTDGPMIHAGGALRSQIGPMVLGVTGSRFGAIFNRSGWEVAGLVGVALEAAPSLRVEGLVSIGYRELSISQGGLVDAVEPAFEYGSPYLGLRLGIDHVWSGASPFSAHVGAVLYATFDVDSADHYTFAFESCDLFGSDCVPRTRTGRHGGGWEVGLNVRFGFGARI